MEQERGEREGENGETECKVKRGKEEKEIWSLFDPFSLRQVIYLAKEILDQLSLSSTLLSP